jgi:hypothetical protein
MRAAKLTLDRYAEIGTLAQSVRTLLNRWFWPLALCLGVVTASLVLRGQLGSIAFALISLGSLIVLGVWRGSGEGLPILPLLAVQTLIAYGLPILLGNETVVRFSESAMTKAGLEVLIYCGAMAVGWSIGMMQIATSSRTCYALQGFEEKSMAKVGRLGVSLLVAGASVELLRSLQLLDFILALLPPGSNSIINVLLSAVSACGFFLSAMLVGKGLLGPTARLVLWSVLAFQCYVSASGFLLSSTMTMIFSVLIGLFWGSGRVPWRFIIVVLAVLSFLNLGKFTMRERYWKQEDAQGVPQFTLAEMPVYYAEWIEASVDAINAESANARNVFAGQDKKAEGQSMADRVNNLQNLLFVIDAMEPGQIKPLGGATYSLIPPLLVPRILWSEKPRTHEGQILLNVHFGRQDLQSTMKTFIAWGLLPEAYGNFGPIAGAIIVGACIGFFFAWIEKLVARKLLLSMEGFLSFTLFLGMANSFEMVASVLITSIFQSLFPVILASKPFVEWVTPKLPSET